jgi:CDP-diacylglycerol---glycerol-3-phosphate 3-phosphatidyltransferase
MSMKSVFTPANLLTFLRIALVPVYLWLFSIHTWSAIALALAVFIGAAVTDLYDGRLARSRKEITRLGKFLDPLADKFLVIGALAQFGIMGLVNIWLVGIIVLRDIWVTVLRVNAIIKGTDLRTSGNAKLKTTIQLTVVITIIVFTGVRLFAHHHGYEGPLTDLAMHRIFFDVLVSIAMMFTVYSWIEYLFGRHPAKV